LPVERKSSGIVIAIAILAAVVIAIGAFFVGQGVGKSGAEAELKAERDLNTLLNLSELEGLGQVEGTIYVTGHKSPDSDTVGSAFHGYHLTLNGGTITETVSTALTYDTAYTNVSNLWSVLLMTGYVTPVSQSRGLDAKNRRTVELRIPNTEVAHIFQGVVDEHFNQTVDRSQVTALLNALWKGEVEEAQKILSDLLWLTISYMDYHENFYHAFLAGIFVGGGYKPKSNKERGLGRPDIDLRDKRKRSALIIETKRSETEEQMEYWCDEALRQIKNHEYDLHLDEYKHILRYGIAFYKKKAMIKKM
jgi:hypothetical protein